MYKTVRSRPILILNKLQKLKVHVNKDSTMVK